MVRDGFECRGLCALRWLAPLLAVVMGIAVGLAFTVAVLLWQDGGTVGGKDQTRVEMRP